MWIAYSISYVDFFLFSGVNKQKTWKTLCSWIARWPDDFDLNIQKAPVELINDELRMRKTNRTGIGHKTGEKIGYS